MKIASSSIDLQATRNYSEQTLTKEKLHYWNKSTDITVENTGVVISISESAYKLVEESNKQSQNMQTVLSKAAEQTKVNSSEESIWKLSDADKLKIQLIEKFIETVSGKKVSLRILDYKNPTQEETIRFSHLINPQKNTGAVNGLQPSDWGLTYEAYTSYKEEERTAFAATGLIRTADGQDIPISLSITMSHQFTRTTGLSFNAGSILKDPLVLNFEGKATQLTGVNFQFDLDADGFQESIPFVQPGSGFLALDKNSDNIINNGLELFGVKTGQGFSELAAFDEDYNNWIDENDSIFSRLRIWTKDEAGNDQLFTLAEKEVGAIYLGHSETQFALKDQNNLLKGEINSTGIYLTDKGQARTIQQVDLCI